MSSAIVQYKEKITGLVREWREKGLPGRDTLIKTGEYLLIFKRENIINGLWRKSPLFVTATLDDAWGHGLELIELYAEVLGLQVARLGLLVSAEEIISACRERNPDYLGMTVLQFDSEEALCTIGHSVSPRTKLIVGGPIFNADPEIAARANVHFVAKNVAAFVAYFLSRQ